MCRNLDDASPRPVFAGLNDGGVMRALLVPFLAAGVAVSGCATKKYVTREVGEVNQKLYNLTPEM